MAAGRIYILKNDSYRANILKIGKTVRSAEHRAKELSNLTAVARPFRVVFEIETIDCDRAEALIFEKLADHRYAGNREFFDVPFEKAAQVVMNVAASIANEHFDYKFVGERSKPAVDDLLDATDEREFTCTPFQIKETLKKELFDDHDMITLFGQSAFDRAKILHYSDYVNRLDAMGEAWEVFVALECRRFEEGRLINYQDYEHIEELTIPIILQLTLKERLAVCMHYHNEGNIDSEVFFSKTYYHEVYRVLIVEGFVGFRDLYFQHEEFAFVFKANEGYYGYFSIDNTGVFTRGKKVDFASSAAGALRSVMIHVKPQNLEVINKSYSLNLLSKRCDFDWSAISNIVNT
jgi:hypothetical protein